MRRGVANMAAGLLNQLLIIVVGLIVPRMFLLRFGSEINGLIMTVNDIFMYFVLLEAGVGAAALQAMYRTVAQGDDAATSGVFAAAAHYYRRTGFGYLGAVIVLAVGFPLFADTSLPRLTVGLLVASQGLIGVINYQFTARFKVLFQAEGKEYLIFNLNLLALVLTNLAKIALMALGFDIIWVQSAALVVCVLQNLLVLLYTRRKYGWLNRSASPDFAAVAHKNSALVHQISALAFNNIDILLLSIFCDFKTVSVYVLYSMLFSMIFNALVTLSGGVSYLMGQAYNLDRDRFARMFNCFETYLMALIFTVFIVAAAFARPFVRLYTVGVTDVNYIVPFLPLLFLIVQLLSAVRIPGAYAINYAGHFKETMRGSIAESVINLAVSLAGVALWGIYGVLVGTIAALLFRSNDIIVYSARAILKRGVWTTYKKIAAALAVSALSYAAFGGFAASAQSYGSIIVKSAACFTAMGALMLAVMSLLDRAAFCCLKGIVFGNKEG